MRYRKKPVEVEAVRFDGENYEDVLRWMGGGQMVVAQHHETSVRAILIETLEGDMLAHPGSYVIRGVQGELYPCRADIFESTYEPVEEQ